MWLSLSAVAIVIVTFGVGYLFHSRAEREIRARAGWHGNAAAVILLLALFASMVITSLLVIGMHAWLTTPAESPETVQFWRQLPTPAPDAAAGTAPDLGAIPTLSFAGLLKKRSGRWLKSYEFPGRLRASKENPSLARGGGSFRIARTSLGGAIRLCGG